MPLARKYPNLDPDIVIGGKEVCAEIGCSPSSLRRYKKYGWINQINPGNNARPKYTGREVNRLWMCIVRSACHI